MPKGGDAAKRNGTDRTQRIDKEKLQPPRLRKDRDMKSSFRNGLEVLQPKGRHLGRLLTRTFASTLAVLAAALVLSPALAMATTPSLVNVEGSLHSAGGGPAADGSYNITFGIYKDALGGNPVFTEGPISVGVKNGLFAYQLGTGKAISAATLANLPTAYLSIKVDTDPEMPRQALTSAPFALRAALAEGVDCTGCISLANLDPAVLSAYAKTSSLSPVAGSGKYTDLVGTPNLSVFAQIAALAPVATSGKYTDLTATPDLTVYALNSSISKVGTTGKYSDLIGAPTLAVLGQDCGSGLVIKGLKADGTYNCVQAAAGPVDPANLPPDGLNEVSNNLLTDQFTDVVNGNTNIAIKDYYPPGVTDTIVFPDIGSAQALSISVDLGNTDVSTLRVSVFDPKNVEYILCGGIDGSGNKYPTCGLVNGTTLKTSYPVVTKPVKGDLTTWIGANPKGNWILTVVDSGFCANCNGVDGKINSWNIALSTLSTKKVQVNGDMIMNGNMSFASGGVNGAVAFNGPVSLNNVVNNISPTWCPTQLNGQPSFVVNGICVGVGSGNYVNWSTAAATCASRGGDVCSGAQSEVLRRAGMLPYNPQGGGTYCNWINSYSDNDSSYHGEAVGNGSDDQGAGSGCTFSCCFNTAPSRPTDTYVKVNANDKGVRVVFLHNIADTTFGAAAQTCASMNADMCDKSELVYLRTAGKLTATPAWGNDGEDTDGVVEYGTGASGAMANDVQFGYGYAFACCGRDRTTATCPVGATATAGVCWTKVNNTGANWTTAANDCAASGTHVCSVSQSSVLRTNGVLTAAGSWSGGFNDCDGQCSGNNGIGNASDNLNQGFIYGYACCY